jgi:flagellar basal body-associated protein FliL
MCGASSEACEELVSEGPVVLEAEGKKATFGTYIWTTSLSGLTIQVPDVPTSLNTSDFSNQYSESATEMGLDLISTGSGFVSLSSNGGAEGAVAAAIVQPNQPAQRMYGVLGTDEGSWAVLCPAELIASAEPLVCWTSGSFDITFLATGWTRVSVEVAGDLPLEIEDDLATLLLHRMHLRAQTWASTQTIVDSNSARMAHSRSVVGGTWFLLMLFLLCFVLAAAAMLSWMAPILPSPRLLMLAWFLLLAAISLGVGWGTGFTGWMVVISLLVAISLVAGTAIVFTFCRRRRSWQPDENVAPMRLKDIGDVDSISHHERGESWEFDKPADFPVSQPAGRMPEELSKLQRYVLCGCLIAMILVAVIIVALVLGWRISMYMIYDRTTQQEVEEFQPQTVAKALALAYSFDGLAAMLKFSWLLGSYSTSCGEKYSAPLTNEEKASDIKKDFIDKYDINMTMYSPSDYT